MNVHAVLYCRDDALQSYAEALAERFGFVLNAATLVPDTPVLHLTEKGLAWHHLRMQPLLIDFVNPERRYRGSPSAGPKEMLVQACGIKKNQVPLTMIDLTAGFAKDACILANAGCHVTLVERHPVVVALLEDALKRAAEAEHPIVSRLNLQWCNAEHFLEKHTEKPDVIYIDPMHPERQKSALVKKDMQILQYWLEPEEHPEKLLSLSLSHAKNRVVLKWPRRAPSISGFTPDYVLQGDTVRFEVYLR